MKKKFVGLFAILAIGLLLTAGAVSAFGPWGFANNEDVDRAIEDGDFQAWREIHQNQLTEDNFERTQEMYQERQGRMRGDRSLRDAIEADDYQAYADAVLEIHPDATVISESDFEILVEMHQARLDGDMDTWSEFRDDTDFTPGMYGHGQGAFMGKGHGMGRGLNQGNGQMLHYEDCPLAE